jgi:hypothetical protein
MGRTKGRSTRGKSRVSQAPMGHIDPDLLATFKALDRLGSTVTDHCPLCVAWGVVLPPSGAARDIERAAVEPVPPGTV